MEKSRKPKIRFRGYTDDWEQRKFKELYSKSGEKNDGSIGISKNITVSTMQFKGDVKVSTPEYLKTYYTFNLGDIAFEGHQSKEFRYGRFVENDIGNGIVSHIFSVFRPIQEYDLHFWKYAINNEELMQHILSRSTKASTMMHDLVTDDFLNETFLVPSLSEQEKVGSILHNLDNLITLHQRKLDKLINVKKSMLEKMFPKQGSTVPEIRFTGFTNDWEQRELLELITEYKETVEADCDLPILTSSKTEGVLLQEEHFGHKQNHDITGYNVLPRNYCTYRNRSDGIDFTFNINKCCDKGIISKFYPVFCGKENDTFFISLVLNNSDEVVREIGYTCTGTGQKVLAFVDLLKMNLKVPSYEEQKIIASYFEGLNHLITLHQCELEKLQNIKKSMLEKMFV